MPTEAAKHVSSLSVRIDGSPLPEALASRVLEVRVKDSLILPDMASVRIMDPRGETVDDQRFAIGKALEVRTGAADDTTATTVFQGEIVAMEPEFTAQGCIIALRAYDRAHRLNRDRKSRAFNDVSLSDLVRRIAGEHGLSPKVDGGSQPIHKHIQQSDETDWTFLNRLAIALDMELVASDRALECRPAGGGAAGQVKLKWMDNLIAFKPRATGTQQPQQVTVRGYDPATNRPIVGNASSPALSSTPGLARAQGINGLPQAKVTLSHKAVTSQSEANQAAQAALNRMANAWFEADGASFGNPAIKAGGKVTIEGVGRKFGGTFAVSSSEHVYRGAKGYETRFTISGRSPRTLVELLNPRQKKDWGASLVVGIVTNNRDPEDLGRIKVKFPALGDDMESAWARVASPNAGKDRGLMMLPQVNDEVVVGFEHGDTRRPYVLGSLWHGKAKPGDDLTRKADKQDGSFALKSDKKFFLKAADELTMTTAKAMKVEVGNGQEVTVKQGNATLKSSSGAVEIEAGQSVKLKGGSTMQIETSGSLTIKAATITIEGSAGVNIKGAIINLG